MDLTEIIRSLYAEKAKVENSIAALEALGTAHSPAPERVGRRGRKHMAAEERQQVSERMKRYWDNRRQARAGMRAATSS